MITDEETTCEHNMVWIDDTQLKAVHTHHEKRLLKLIGSQAKLSEIVNALPYE
jgi:hypothetical protein